MKNKEQVQFEFTERLKALLAEYNTEMAIEDISTTGYMQNLVIGVYIPTVWNGDEIISDSASFNFGCAV